MLLHISMHNIEELNYELVTESNKRHPQYVKEKFPRIFPGKDSNMTSYMKYSEFDKLKFLDAQTSIPIVF